MLHPINSRWLLLHPLWELKSSADVLLSRGILSLTKKLAEKILNWEFDELPPACGLSKSSHTPGSNILLVQLADSIQGHKKIMTDIQTWMQCFSVYASILAPWHIPELLACPRDIMRVSRQFKWPSWVIYIVQHQLSPVYG